jgi:hypothetical protein
MISNYNFRLLSIDTQELKNVTEYSIIEGFQIYHSTHNETHYIIYDHEFHVYRWIEFVGQSNLELVKNFNLYMKDYITLEDNERCKIIDFF